jgi:hypothetical protein
MAKSLSPSEHLSINDILKSFNQENGTNLQVIVRGRFVYVFILEGDIETKLGRMEYHGKPDNWSFAIYKYSSERYHPDEFGYPGFFELDGTITGALKACMAWYRFVNQ